MNEVSDNDEKRERDLSMRIQVNRKYCKRAEQVLPGAKMVKWKVKNDFVRSDIYKESVLKQ